MDAKDDPGGHRKAKATHERAARTHDAAAKLHEGSASLHQELAVEMREKGHPERIARAERIADHERDLAEQERARATSTVAARKPNRFRRTDRRLDRGRGASAYRLILSAAFRTS